MVSTKNNIDGIIPAFHKAGTSDKFSISTYLNKSEWTTASQPLAIYRRLGRTGDEWRVGHVVLKKTLISFRMDGLILLYLLS